MVDSVKTYDQGDTDVCDCCRFEKKVKLYGQNPFERPTWLCEICASSLASLVFIYPDQYTGDTQKIVGCVMYGVQVILKQLKETKTRIRMACGGLRMNTCKHKNEEHHADNSSSSGGCIYWCPDCGAISSTQDRDTRRWKFPKNIALIRLREAYLMRAILMSGEDDEDHFLELEKESGMTREDLEREEYET